MGKPSEQRFVSNFGFDFPIREVNLHAPGEDALDGWDVGQCSPYMVRTLEQSVHKVQQFSMHHG